VDPPAIVVIVKGITMGLPASGIKTGGFTVIVIGVGELDAAKLPLAPYAAVTLSVPIGKSTDAIATPFVNVAELATVGVLFVAVV
jgi:hypothetical protein